MKFKQIPSIKTIKIIPKKTNLQKLCETLTAIPHLKNIEIGKSKPIIKDEIAKTQFSLKDITLTFDSPEHAKEFHTKISQK